MAAGQNVSRETPFLRDADPDLEHYETGPMVERSIELEGRLFTARYHSRWEQWHPTDRRDGGWRVFATEIVPKEDADDHFQEGDILHVRGKLVEDAGSDIKMAFEGPRKRVTLWLPRSLVTHRETAPKT